MSVECLFGNAVVISSQHVMCTSQFYILSCFRTGSWSVFFIKSSLFSILLDRLRLLWQVFLLWYFLYCVLFELWLFCCYQSKFWLQMVSDIIREVSNGALMTVYLCVMLTTAECWGKKHKTWASKNDREDCRVSWSICWRQRWWVCAVVYLTTYN